MSDNRSCDFTAEDIFLWLTGSLEEDVADKMEQHIATCATCRARLAREERLTAELCLALPAEEPPAAVRGRLMARVVADASRPALETARFRLGNPRRRRLLRRLAVAASLVVATGVGFSSTYWVTPPWNEPKQKVRSLERRYQAALAHSEAEVRRLSGDPDVALAHDRRAAPAVHELHDRDPWLVRDRDGRPIGSIVCLREGLNCYLEATGVDRVGPSRVYVLWLRTEDGDVVNLGSFDADTSGNASFHTYADRALSRAKDLMVTVEPWEKWRSQPHGPVVFESNR